MRLKSKAVIRNVTIEPLLRFLDDLKIKAEYDDTFESGFVIHDLPFKASVSYQKYKKVMVVDPRDMILFTKTQWTSENEVFIIGQTMILDSHPPNKKIVRAESALGGWRIK